MAVSLGASLIGAAFSSNLTSSLADRIGALASGSDPEARASLAQFGDADTSSLTPALVNRLPAALHDAVAGAYADALLPIFGWMIPLFVLTSIIALLLPEVPLSRKTGMEQIAEAERAERTVRAVRADVEPAETGDADVEPVAGVEKAESASAGRSVGLDRP